MAKTGVDRPARPEPRRPSPSAPKKDRTTPFQYLREVQGEMKKVAWPTRPEVITSTIVVVIGIIVMGAIIFGFDYVSIKIVDFIFG
jgi:preprotein translocase subunit SecE